MEENRYKLTEDNAAAGMVAEPTPVVRPSLSVQEMRHCLMDAIYSSKDVDKLYSCLLNCLMEASCHTLHWFFQMSICRIMKMVCFMPYCAPR